MIHFRINGTPPRTTHQNGIRYTRFGKPYKSKQWKEVEAYLFNGMKEYVPAKPLESAVKLSVVWAYPAKRKKDIGKPKVTKPDTDNLNKGLKDVMTSAGFWVDDNQVAIEHIEKRYEKDGFIEIEIEEVKDDE